MGERDYSPLSTACVRALSDKLYDKRKAAALEIEKMVKEFSAVNNRDQITRLIRVLEDFALSHNPHTRKGGLIGLAAVAIGLGSRGIGPYIQELVHPILACFTDSNPNVRYYATESLYNVVRVSRGAILSQFNDIFIVLVKLATDADQNVKNGSEMLDRMMKDIVTESAAFDLVAFIPVLREKLYSTNHWAQTLVVSWVSVLHKVPDVDTVTFLPEILDGLFFILEAPKPEVKKMCEAAVGEFQVSIKRAPDRVKFADMISILITHAQSPDQLVQQIALTWIGEFVKLSGRAMLPCTSGILAATVPCLAMEDPAYAKTRGTAEEVSSKLMALITTDDDNNESESFNEEKEDETVKETATNQPEDLDLTSVMEVLLKQLCNTAVPCKTAVLRWIYHLHDKIPNRMCKYVEELFHVLLRTLSDPSDEVVLLVIQVLAQIASTNSQPNMSEVTSCKNEGGKVDEYFTRFLQNLLHIFATERNLLEDRGPFIIRQLCVMLSAEDIYRTLAELLLKEENLTFASLMVQTLSSILLTSKELFTLRLKLKDLSSPESCKLFVVLYKSWSHNPVAMLTLCLLTQNYSHAATLVHAFGNIEVTTDFLVEVDKLVQLIESPIFTYLRLQLLDPVTYSALVETLYGLLMLLPQSDAFTLLRCRLNCVPPAHLLKTSHSSAAQVPQHHNVDFEVLLQHFLNMQEKHRMYKHHKIKQRLESTIDLTVSQ
ncbi:protein VAC14 homolog [Oratosquilla oratoria]|uniref:protein VAC14 homolog n=1 Tax=Oratosquilla oratoria TaxID=337810 RepID=UPI003F776AD6